MENSLQADRTCASKLSGVLLSIACSGVTAAATTAARGVRD
jgi:hypothetical protein